MITSLEKTAPPEVRADSQRRAWEPGFRASLILSLVFTASLVLWFALDHSNPGADESGFILNSFRFAELFDHPRLLKAAWWHDVLSVNQFYPPFVLAVSGLVKVALGPAHWLDIAQVLGYNLVLSLSVYTIARKLTNDKWTSFLAVGLINLYPIIAHLSRRFLLDGPLVAMIAVGLLSLLWWREKPTWGRATVSGIALGLACLSKQIAAAYLLLPGLMMLYEAAKADSATKRLNQIPQVLTIAALTAAIMLPWVITSIQALRSFAQYGQEHIGQLTFMQAMLGNLQFYSEGFVHAASPLLCLLFVLSLVFVGQNTQRQLNILLVSAVGGLLLVCTLKFMVSSDRYIAPAMITMAIFSAAFLSKLIRRGWATAPVAAVFLGLATIQLASLAYAPYPIAAPNFAAISPSMGESLREVARSGTFEHIAPMPPSDWGQRFVLETIRRTDGDKPSWLNILPCLPELNVHTFELLCKYENSKTMPTTSRTWTQVGDIVQFSPEKALYYDWYLLKTGGQGNLMRTQESEVEYNRLQEFIKSSGKFKLVATHQIADGSTLLLYRQ